MTPPRDPWPPRQAMPFSVITAPIGAFVMLVGFGMAADRSAAMQAATLVAGAGSAVGWGGAIVRAVRRWNPESGPLAIGARGCLVVFVVITVTFTLARVDATAPVGVAGLGGAWLGCMVGNVVAIRRFRRSR